MFRLSYDNGCKGHFIAVEVNKKKGKRKLLLIHFNVAISHRFSYQNTSHWLLYPQVLPPHTKLTYPPSSISTTINNGKSKNRRRQKNIRHPHPRLEWSHSRVKATILKERALKFIFQNYILYCISNDSDVPLSQSHFVTLHDTLFNFRYLPHTLQFTLTMVTLNYVVFTV